MSTRRFGSSKRNHVALFVAGVLLLGACSNLSSGSDSNAADPQADDEAMIASETTTVSTTVTTAATAPETVSTAETGTTIAPADVELAKWTTCEGGLECATVSVPLDHDEPAGETIEIALVRVPSSGSARGSIFVNPGGPGGSGVATVRNGFRLDDATLANYHLVGFDPRGIGDSTPLRCTADLTDGPRPDLSPDSPEEVEALNNVSQELAERCRSQSGDLLPHLGTDSVIADLDILRRAVGDDQLHYYGFSYGTLIGLRYADRYPGNVGHLVLDGVVDPSFSLPDLLRQQAVAFDAGFDALDEACETELSCPPAGLAASYDQLSIELEELGPQGGVGSAELDFATLISLYSESLWPIYATAVGQALDGDYSRIERLHDAYAGVTNFAAYAAISCYDSPSPRGPAEWDSFARELAAISPRFGFALANELRTCAYWDERTGPAPKPIRAEGAKPVLVLTTTDDVATPAENAQIVASQLTGAGLVIAEGKGHTTYRSHPCVHRYVAEYFVDDRLPQETVRC